MRQKTPPRNGGLLFGALPKDEKEEEDEGEDQERDLARKT